MKFFLSCVLLIYLSLNINRSDGLRILGIFPFPMRSHQTICEELMKGLAAKGHQVDVYSHFPLKKSVPNYTDYSLEGAIPIFSNNVTYETISREWVGDVMPYWFGVYAKSLCALMDLPIFQKLLRNPPQDPPYDIVVTEVCVLKIFNF